MSASKTTDLLSAFQKATVLRGRDLEKLGFSRTLVSDAVKRGAIERVGRGMYTTPTADISEKHSYVQVARAVPNAVLCLLSACRFHDLTTQNPFEVWFAIEPKAWRPKITFVKTRIVRFSGPAYTEGIETHRCEGCDVKVYSAAKTVADLFKYRTKYGLDIAVEALRDALRYKKCTVDELHHYAKLRHVSKVMDHYFMAYLSV